LLFDDYMSNNLRRLMRRHRYTVTFDRDFESVILAACSTSRIMRVYAEAFDAGYAHSFEVWNTDGELVAGGYGIATGAAFNFESQFAYESNASKIGMTVLNWHLANWGYLFNDGELIDPLWRSVGFHEIPRHEFLACFSEAVRVPHRAGRWRIESVETVSHGQP
jgi:leucyl/phenylalanyl-tRNA--protein transferase